MSVPVTEQVRPARREVDVVRRALSGCWAVALLLVAWQAWITLGDVPATVGAVARRRC